MKLSKGVGKSGRPKGKRISDLTRRVIFAERQLGFTNAAIADRHSVSEQSITRICNAVPAIGDPDNCPEMLRDTWRDSLRIRALGLVFSSLMLIEDPKDRANTSIQVLKGLGVFNPDSMQVTNMMFQSMPSDWSSDYASCVHPSVSESESATPPSLDQLSTSPNHIDINVIE